MNTWQLAVVIIGSLVIMAVVILIVAEARRPYPDPHSYLTEALREAWYEQRAEMFRPYLIQHCQHPFPDYQPDGTMACYQCGRGIAPVG
jgi:hypothetical protein